MLELSFIKKYAKRKKQTGYVNASLFNTLKVYYFFLWFTKDSFSYISNVIKKHLLIKNKVVKKNTVLPQKKPKENKTISHFEVETVNPFVFEEEKITNNSFFTGLNIFFILLFMVLFYGANEYFSQTKEVKKEVKQVVNTPVEKKLTIENNVKKMDATKLILEKKLKINPFTGENSDLIYPIEEKKDVFQLQEKSQIIENSSFKIAPKISQNSPKDNVKKTDLVDKKVEKMAVLEVKPMVSDLIVENTVNTYQPLPFNETTLKERPKIKFYGTVSKEQ
jgi:hypothetical protein